MNKSLNTTKLIKGAVWGLVTVMFALSCMFLLSACGPKEAPIELSGKSATVDWTKTEFEWKDSATEQEKTELKESMMEGPVVTFVFNTDGSATGFSGFFIEEVLYYTQDGASLKFYSDAEKTTSAVPAQGGVQFEVKTDGFRLRADLGQETDQIMTAYTMIFVVNAA